MILMREDRAAEYPGLLAHEVPRLVLMLKHVLRAPDGAGRLCCDHAENGRVDMVLIRPRLITNPGVCE